MKSKKPVWRHPVIRICALALMVYLGLILYVALTQRSLIYYPHGGDEDAMIEQAERTGKAVWRNPQGERTGWRVDAEAGEGVLMVFHGNAGNALMRDYWVQAFRRTGVAGFRTIYLFEYPGYGGRAGRPSEKAIMAAAGEAFDQVLTESETQGERIYLLGESLGSGVATALAAEHSDLVSGVLLVTPFTSLSAAGKAHFPHLPVSLLLIDRYDNVEHLRSFRRPVAFLVAGQDSVVPARLGRELYESYDATKQLWELKSADHNTLFSYTDPPLWAAILNFLRAD